MDLEQIEELIRRYLAAGVAVVVILAGPVTGAAEGPGPSAAQSGAVDAADGEVEIRDGTPGADDGADPSGTPAPRDPADDGAGERSAEEGGAEDADRDPTDPAAADTADPGETADPEDVTEPEDATDRDADPDATPSPSAPVTGNPDTDDDGKEVDVTDSADADDPADADTTEPVTGAPAAGGTTTAAERFGWGPPERADDFRAAGLRGWEPYTGPGHRGRGERSPDALAVRDGVLTISGDARGTTGGACWGGGQRYGRWEARVRAPEADPAYHALLLLWPDADDFPAGGQVDFLELTDPRRRSAEFYLHSGEDGDPVRSEVRVDATGWHAWAVEWTPDRITGYVDGEEWFSATDPRALPPRPMHLCVQLDFFPAGDAEVRPSRMDVDWVRQYAP